jgi:hypothetical protein
VFESLKLLNGQFSRSDRSRHGACRDRAHPFHKRILHQFLGHGSLAGAPQTVTTPEVSRILDGAALTSITLAGTRIYVAMRCPRLHWPAKWMQENTYICCIAWDEKVFIKARSLFQEQHFMRESNAAGELPALIDLQGWCAIRGTRAHVHSDKCLGLWQRPASILLSRTNEYHDSGSSISTT